MAQVSSAEITELLKTVAQKVVSEPEAEYFAKETVEAHIRKSPRTSPLDSAIKDLEACLNNSDESLKYAVDLPAYLAIDFNGQGPLPYLKKIHDEIEHRANSSGLAMVAFTNSKSMHTLHDWVQGLAKRGLLAIAICNGGPSAVVPYNGTKGLFGTNPIAYGIPGQNGDIYCIDMATSEIPYFEILDANKNHESLKEHSAVNNRGEFTTSASEALDFSASQTDPVSNLVSIGGGYKGYYLTFLTEIMTSALIGMPASSQMSSGFVPEEHGAMLLAFSPKAMGTEEKFQASMESLHQALKSQTSKEGTNINMPGERNNQRYQQRANALLEIDQSLLDKLDSLSQ